MNAKGLMMAVGLMVGACGGSGGGASVGDDAGGTGPAVSGGGENDAGADAIAVVDAGPPPAACDATKLPTEDACVVDEPFGVFVSASLGSDVKGDGSRARPFATVAHGIAAGAQASRRVYACAESYAENVTLADGVSVFGYFDCASGWTVGAGHARVVAPKSPAAIASGITKATRIEALDLVAPDVSGAGASSIGLSAQGSPGLRFVHATLHGGAAGKGADGASGTQLTLSGGDGTAGGIEGAFTVFKGVVIYTPNDSVAGAAGKCLGESGHDPASGGDSGSGGKFKATEVDFGLSKSYYFVAESPAAGNGTPAVASTGTAAGGTQSSRTGGDGSPGAPGASGSTGSAVGTFSASGYQTSDGTPGTSGAPGQSGGGGAGQGMTSTTSSLGRTADYYPIGSDVWGTSGGTGAAGGCPGLAGTSGQGGGASVGVLAIASAMSFESSVIESSAGGAGGKAGVPSKPTGGGSGGLGVWQGLTMISGRGGNGGFGGLAGWSGSGGGGPSIAIAFKGGAPSTIATTLSPGKPGAGAPAQTSPGGTVPASPDGLSKEQYSF